MRHREDKVLSSNQLRRPNRLPSFLLCAPELKAAGRRMQLNLNRFGGGLPSDTGVHNHSFASAFGLHAIFRRLCQRCQTNWEIGQWTSLLGYYVGHARRRDYGRQHHLHRGLPLQPAADLHRKLPTGRKAADFKAGHVNSGKVKDRAVGAKVQIGIGLQIPGQDVARNTAQSDELVGNADFATSIGRNQGDRRHFEVRMDRLQLDPIVHGLGCEVVGQFQFNRRVAARNGHLRHTLAGTKGTCCNMPAVR